MPYIRVTKTNSGSVTIKSGSTSGESLSDLLRRAGVEHYTASGKRSKQNCCRYRGLTLPLLSGLERCGYKMQHFVEGSKETIYILHKEVIVDRLPVILAARKSCPVCMDDKIDDEFYTLHACSHAVCRECLEKSITIAIVDRNVKTLKCLNDHCSKPIDYTDVSKLIDAEMFRTFDRLLMETEIIGMADAETCPNEECGLKSFFTPPTNNNAQQNVAACPHCRTEFCLLCKKLVRNAAQQQHRCEQSDAAVQQAVDAYENATTNQQERERFESIYGKEKLQNWVANRQSERVVERKKKCPHCRAPTDKDLGCNHMTCKTCNTHWCWLCCKEIVGPWSVHFNEGDCLGRLFENMIEE